MPGASAELKRLLGAFNEQAGADLSMVATRTGAPLAHEGPRELSADTFASLAATLLTAAEALYAGLGRPAPTRILVESEKGTLVASALGTKALFVAVGDSKDRMLRGVGDVTASIRTVLAAKP